MWGGHLHPRPGRLYCFLSMCWGRKDDEALCRWTSLEQEQKCTFLDILTSSSNSCLVRFVIGRRSPDVDCNQGKAARNVKRFLMKRLLYSDGNEKRWTFLRVCWPTTPLPAPATSCASTTSCSRSPAKMELIGTTHRRLCFSLSLISHDLCLRYGAVPPLIWTKQPNKQTCNGFGSF